MGLPSRKNAKPRVRRYTLAQLGVDLKAIVGERLRRVMPDASKFRIVTRKGRPEAQVELPDESLTDGPSPE